jgi:hypothetical protein
MSAIDSLHATNAALTKEVGCLRKQLDTAQKRLASIRPISDAEWAALMREHDVVEAARRLCKSAGEINSTKDLDRALKRYDDARASLRSLEGALPENPSAGDAQGDNA